MAEARSTQYVVVYMPYSELVAEAVGPFRSKEKAEAASNAIEEAWVTTGADFGVVPQVVALGTLAAILRDERFAPEAAE
jgi:hypothetical protein